MVVNYAIFPTQLRKQNLEYSRGSPDSDPDAKSYEKPQHQVKINSFAIGDSPIAYSPTDTYFRALLVGLVNSLRIMITGIFLAISLGIVIGLGRLSDNWLIRQLATIYWRIKIA